MKAANTMKWLRLFKLSFLYLPTVLFLRTLSSFLWFESAWCDTLLLLSRILPPLESVWMIQLSMLIVWGVATYKIGKMPWLTLFGSSRIDRSVRELIVTTLVVNDRDATCRDYKAHLNRTAMSKMLEKKLVILLMKRLNNDLDRNNRWSKDVMVLAHIRLSTKIVQSASLALKQVILLKLFLNVVIHSMKVALPSGSYSNLNVPTVIWR